MLTYQLQDRIFRILNAETLSFPNKLKLEIRLGPPELFGMSDRRSRTVVFGGQAAIIYDANTGRMLVQSEPSLEPLDVVVESSTTRFELKGDLVHYEAPCQDVAQLEGCLAAFQYVFLALLNIEFADPPIVLHVQGWLGSTHFRWEHRESIFPFRPMSSDALESHVADSFKQLALFNGMTNRRLAAALHYFLTASRLIVAGHSNWEFMAESVLNMCKSLEVLFGNSRDTIRGQLSLLGYTTDQIEGDFIPLLVLRSHFDVAHAWIAVPKQEKLRVLYAYWAHSEYRLKAFFKSIPSPKWG